MFHRESGTLRMDGVPSCGQAPRAPRTLPLAGPELLLGVQLCCICLSICYFLRQLLGYTFSQLLLQPATGMALDTIVWLFYYFYIVMIIKKAVIYQFLQ